MHLGTPEKRRRKVRGQGGERETARAGARALPTLTREETGPRGPSGVTGGWGGLRLGSDGGEGPKSWGTGAPGSNGPPQTGPSPSVRRRRRLGPRTPAAVPAPTPLGAWRPGRVGRLGPDPPRTSAACRPASPTQTDLSRPPLAPPPPSRTLLRLLPKLFPLIPAPPRPRVTRSAAPPRPRGRDVTAQLGLTPPLSPPLSARAGQSARLLEAPLMLPLRPPHAALAAAAPSGAGCGPGRLGRSWEGAPGQRNRSSKYVSLKGI